MKSVNLDKGKCDLIANFSATVVKSLSLSLSLSLSKFIMISASTVRSDTKERGAENF